MEIAMNVPLQTSSLFRPATRLSSISVSEMLKIAGLATNLKRQGRMSASQRHNYLGQQINKKG
jgi:hypothetical protein